MPRKPRITIEGYPYHITQRGNYKQNIFIDDRDRVCYLKWLNKYCSDHKLSILAYCLMPNHVHFICIPHTPWSLSKVFKVVNVRYSNYFHAKNALTGHLWQGRFYSCILDQEHLFCAVRYVENNTVRAGLTEEPEDWKWSSARKHLGLPGRSYIKLANIADLLEIDDWRAYLSERENIAMVRNLQKSARSGMPCGADDFIEKIEKITGRDLKSPTMGR